MIGYSCCKCNTDMSERQAIDSLHTSRKIICSNCINKPIFKFNAELETQITIGEEIKLHNT